ncbi:MAG: DUF1254 domain-containing protein [Sphingopyxis sp.]
MKRALGMAVAALVAGAVGYYGTLHAAPGFLMSKALDRITTRGPWNAFTHAPQVNARAQFVVRPSPDLLYSTCPFDLDAGPLEVTAEPIPGRYSSISVFDAQTNAAFVRNDEDMAGRPMRVVLALDGQAVAGGVRVVRLSAPRGVVLQRVLLADPAEAAEVDPLRRRAVCRTLPQI